jgi:hypothetical protein
MVSCSPSHRVFVTVDRNLSFQQNLATRSISVIVLRARTNRLTDLIPLVPSLLSAIETATPGMLQLVGEP